MIKKEFSKKLVSLFTALVIFFAAVPWMTNQMSAFATQQRYYNFSKNYTLTGNGASDILAVAFAQKGRSKSAFGYTEAWCADFVCDCAYLAGQSSAIPLCGAVSHPYQDKDGERWEGLLQLVLGAGGIKTSSPRPGDLVFWKNSDISHVEIVCRVTNGVTYSIGGNNTVRSESGNYNGCAGERRCTSINSNILCYVRPNYSGSSPQPSQELVTPAVKTEKNTYTLGETVNISWTASPADSNLDHYWLQIFSPDGSTLLNQTMGRNTSFSFNPTQSGDYKIVAWATPYGSLEGEGSLTDTKTIHVNSQDPKFYMSDNTINIGTNDGSQHYVTFSYSDYSGPVTISYEHDNKAITQLEWGEWENNNIKLYVLGIMTGQELITVKFKDTNTGNVLQTFVFLVNITGIPKAIPEKSIYYLDLDDPQPVDVIFKLQNPPSQGKIYFTSWTDDNNNSYVDEDEYDGGIKAVGSIYREGTEIYLKYTITPRRIGRYPVYCMYDDGVNEGFWFWGQTEVIVKGDPEFTVDKTNVEINMDKDETVTLHFKYADKFLWNHQGIRLVRNGSKVVNHSWGGWKGQEDDITLSGYRPGEETLTFELYDTQTKEVLASQDVAIKVTGTTVLKVSDNNVKLNMDENEECTILFTAENIPSMTTTNINVVRNNLKTSSFKWGEWNNNQIELTLSGYCPGKETITFELYDTQTKEVFSKQDVDIEVSGTTELYVTSNHIILDMENGEENSIVISYAKVPTSCESCNVKVERNNTKVSEWKFGKWNSGKIEMSFTGIKRGKEILTISLYDVKTKEVYAAQDIIVDVRGQIRGDANNDGEVTAADAVMLQKWLLGSNKELTCWQNVDLCEDGEIDVFDMIMLRKLLTSGK